MTPASSALKPFIFRRLGADDAAAYRALRLESLQKHPAAFSSSWEEESSQPLAWFEDRLENQVVFGGWLKEGALCGIAGLFMPYAAKLRHKASVAGVYVRPESRRTGLAQALLNELVAYANNRLDTLLLTVEASNTAAFQLYKKIGFEEYGREPRALKVDGTYYDEILMALPLTIPG